jgi:hypothetical protein
MRLSRAALYAFGMGTLTAAAGCSSSSAAIGIPDGSITPLYGGSPEDFCITDNSESCIGGYVVAHGSSCKGVCDGGEVYLLCDCNPYPSRLTCVTTPRSSQVATAHREPLCT